MKTAAGLINRFARDETQKAAGKKGRVEGELTKTREGELTCQVSNYHWRMRMKRLQRHTD